MTTDSVKTVHLVFKTHLDVGFTDFAHAVVRDYFAFYIPRAIELAQMLRERGRVERFIWTTGSWLIYEYLEQASPQERTKMDAAITAGDIVWHGLPFTTHSEMMGPSLFRFGLSLSGALDARYGITTIAAKMTDVPGHTRAIVPLLAAAGIRFLHLGVNPACCPPDVPPVFVWRDPNGAEVVVMYDKGSYGSQLLVPGMSDALAFAHTGDNHGPQSASEIAQVFRRSHEQYPGAAIHASTLDAYARALLAQQAQLPVVTEEIGDSWIHGIGSDPTKVSQFRALCRLRNAWMANGRLAQDDTRFSAFSRALLLIPEHTWGMDTKNALADYVNYARPDFERARHANAPAREAPDEYRPFLAIRTPGRPTGFRNLEASWTEQRNYLSSALQALGQSSLQDEAREVLLEMKPTPPEKADCARIDLKAPIDTAHFTLRFDPATGAILSLVHKISGREWAGETNPLGLLQYETFAQSDYDRYLAQYTINMESCAVWAIPDLSKPGMAQTGAEHQHWLPALTGCWQRHHASGSRYLLEMSMPGKSVSKYGAPAKVTLEIDFPAEAPVIGFNLQWFNKPANRLPEALWFSFLPGISNPAGWRLDKMYQSISPLEVISHGNRHMHAVSSGVSYADEHGALTIESLDAPLVAVGTPALLNFDNQQPALEQGMHFNLYNNTWGTNFPLWFEDDARFRFLLRFGR